MIDKKPFRVTNEQARMLAKLDCTSDLCERCSAFALCEDADFTTVAADLLDARELNDKQEALIKKQSILLQAVEKDLNWMLNEGKLLAPHAFKYFYDGIKELEKTKDYA